MALDTATENNKRFTPETTLDMMAEFIRGGLPLTSCHTQVAHWINTEPDLKLTDEIVMFGQTFFETGKSPHSTVMHSVLMRDGDIIADPLTTGEYDPETQEYTSGMHETSTEMASLKILNRTTLGEFVEKYGFMPPKPELETDDGPDF